MENQYVTNENPNALERVALSEKRLAEAAEWLSVHRDSIHGPAVPFIRQRFCLTTLQAIEALKNGHALRYGRAM